MKKAIVFPFVFVVDGRNRNRSKNTENNAEKCVLTKQDIKGPAVNERSHDQQKKSDVSVLFDALKWDKSKKMIRREKRGTALSSRQAVKSKQQLTSIRLTQ